MTDTVPMPAHITMGPVSSTHHSGAAYDAEAQHLYLDFAKPEGRPNIYRYSNFTPEDWQAYQDAESKGKHFLGNIKPRADKYPYVRVAAPEAAS